MRSIFRLLVLLVLATPAASWACDDGSPVLTFVGQLRGDRLLIREASHGDTRIKLYVLDLNKSASAAYATILSGDEEESEREKLRGQRWKKAQAELQKEGLVLKTIKPQNLSQKVGKVKLSSESSETDEGSGCYTVRLMATDGKKSRELASTGFCSANDSASFSEVVVTPDTRFLIPLIDSGCISSPGADLKAFTIADL